MLRGIPGSEASTTAPVLTEPLATDLTQIDRLRVRYNPNSTQYRRGELTIEDELTRLRESDILRGIYIDASPTSPSIDENIESLEDSDDGTVVLALGGDGTGSRIMTAIHALKRAVPVIIGHRGKIGDLAQQLYDKDDFGQPELLLDFGEVKPIYPLEIVINEELVAMSWLYTTFGISAWAAQKYYNNPAYQAAFWHNLPGGTKFRDNVAALQSLVANHKFTIEEFRNAPEFDRDFSVNVYGRPRYLEELIIANGHQMGGQLGIGGNLFTDEVRIIEARNKTHASILIGGLLVDKAGGELLEGEYRFIAEGTAGNPLIAQIDGDHMAFEEATLFAIRRHPRPAYVYADLRHLANS